MRSQYVSASGTEYTSNSKGILFRDGQIFEASGFILNYGGIIPEGEFNPSEGIHTKKILHVPFHEIYKHMPAHIVCVSLKGLRHHLNLSADATLKDILDIADIRDHLPLSVATTPIEKLRKNGQTVDLSMYTPN